MGQTLELTAGDGFRFSAYRAEPQGKPRGGVVVVHEIFGVNSHIRSVCDGYAADGYRVIVPALFDRAERGVDLGYKGPDIAHGSELKAAVAIDDALRDVAAACDGVGNAGKVGILGFCWGGYVTWMAASRLDGFACAVSYYGSGMTDAIDERPKCPVMAHFGRKDDHIPVPGVEKLGAAHPQTQVFLYDAGHGFNCDQRGSYDAAAAKLARTRTLEFLRQQVG
ncbi:MAG: dienelactone hydrolase family protein [Burkholderiaceae bacterium]